MPQLGESVTEGTLGQWLVKPGDRVSRYQPIAEVITDKVNAEIPAPQDGTIVSLDVAAGETVRVGVLIATMEAVGAAVAAAGVPAAPAQTIEPSRTGGVMAARVETAPPRMEAHAALRAGAAAAVHADGTAAGPTGDDMRGRFSPAVLRLAQEHNVDLAQIQGSGLGGRITRKDVQAAVLARSDGAAPSAPAASPPREVTRPAAGPAHTVFTGPGDQPIPVTPVRRRIAEKMLQAKHEQPHAWTMVRADVTGIVRLRAQQKEEFRTREGVDLTYLPFVVKAVCEGLREFPVVNSTWAGDQIILRRDINISVAVATEDALAVPVIKNADRLTVAGLAHAIADLAQRARAGRLTLDDVQGGTFTVNNTGAFGSFLSAPIINHPQAAILTMEAVVKEPVVLEGDAIAIRSLVNLCCSLDHRVLDGLVVGHFLQAVKRRLEDWGPGTIGIY